MSDQGTAQNGNGNYQEAPASWNTKYLDPSGFECQITLREMTGVNLLKKASAAIQALVDAGCSPVTYNHNSKPKEEAEIHVCEFHNAEMKRYEKDGRSWYSHKLGDGTYCKGKAVSK